MATAALTAERLASDVGVWLAGALADRAGRYVYVSSRSVYDDPPAGATEYAAVVDASPDADETAYPQDKRGAELGALAAFGDRAILARAGLIIGPHDNVGRLPWWLTRSARGGRMLAPGPADAGIQFIDVRDLARWCLRAAADGLGGAYDLVSDPSAATFRDLLDACVRATGSDAGLTWVPPETILKNGIEPWTDLPAWLPPGALHDSLHGSDVSKALAAGLDIRQLDETVADTWQWLEASGGTAPQRADRPAPGLDPEVEARVLAAL